MFRFFRYIALLVGIAAALPAAAKEELSAAQQRKFDYYFYEGLKLKQDGKYDAAYDLFNYCLEIDSTAAPVCIIAPISSWAAAVGSSLKSTGAFESDFTAFVLLNKCKSLVRLMRSNKGYFFKTFYSAIP